MNCTKEPKTQNVFSTILLIASFLAIHFTSTSPVCRETDLQHTASLLCLTAISSAQKLWLGFSIGSFGYQRLRPWWKCCSPWGQGSLLSQNERRGSHQTPASHSTSPPGAGTAATSGGQQALGRSTRDASFQFSGFGISLGSFAPSTACRAPQAKTASDPPLPSSSARFSAAQRRWQQAPWFPPHSVIRSQVVRL